MANDPQAELDELRSAIREFAHDISNPLGVLRMAAYYLQHGDPDEEKRLHYYKVIGDTVERVETGLAGLRGLAVGDDVPPEEASTGEDSDQQKT